MIRVFIGLERDPSAVWSLVRFHVSFQVLIFEDLVNYSICSFFA